MSLKKVFRKTSIILFWLAVWWIVALLVDNTILLVTPPEVVSRLFELLGQGAFWSSILNSLLRIAMGFLLGFGAAVFTAALSFRYPVVEEFLQPLMSLMKTVPVASFVVILLIWWGSSVLAAIICFLVVLPNLYINILEGLKAGDRDLQEMAWVFGISGLNKFFYIYRPAIRPFLESGLKLALGMCWKSGVAAEVIGMPASSIGGQLYLSKIHLDTAGVLAWTLVVILVSVVFERIVLKVSDMFFGWNPSPGKMDAKMCVQEKPANIGIGVYELSKRYGANTLFENCSVKYEPGRIYYLNSPSGSGKTTWLRMLCGLEQPDTGEIQGVKAYSMVFQEDRLCPDYNAVLNVSIVTGNEAFARQALERLLDRDALEKPCSQLSGGMKRRVALVRAMEAASQAVLLDEPFTGMDEETRGRAEEYILEKQNGRVIIIATHI